jgi:glycosyltransferase involved in cell wall biosynthesis
MAGQMGGGEGVRVALVTNLCTHYRAPLFHELARRLDISFFFTSDGSEWYWPDVGSPPPCGVPVAGGRREVVPAILRGGYDCVVVGLNGRTVVPKVFLAARTRRVPFVLWTGIWEHPDTPFHRLSRPLTRRLYRAADALLVYGTHVARFVATESGRRDRIFVAPQAVDNERFRQGVSAQRVADLQRELCLGDAPVAIFVGRLEPEKGLDVLLQASAQVSARHTLVLVGTGSLERRLRRLAAALGTEPRVRFAGRVSQDDLPAYLALSDLLVLPSVTTRRVREAWGLVANEAMNCGLPVIATDAVGAAAGGLVVDGETGLVVPERDSAALASALDRLVRDKELRVMLGRQAQRRVLDLSFAAAADAFEHAIGAAVDRRVAARPEEAACEF